MAAPDPTSSHEATELVNELRGHKGAVFGVKLNLDATYCVSCGQDRTLKLWSPLKGKLIKTYSGHGCEISDLAISEDNSRIVSAGHDRTTALWDVASGQIIRKFRGHTQRVNCVRYAAEDSVLLTGSYDKTVRAWDVRSRSHEAIQVLDEARDSVTSLTAAATVLHTGSVDGCLRAYDLRMGQLRTDHIGHPVVSVTVSRDEQCVLVSCLDSVARVFDAASGELLSQFKGHTNSSYKLASRLCKNDAQVLSGSEDGRIFVWDLVSGRLLRTLDGHTGVVCALDCAVEQPLLLSASMDGSVRVWASADIAAESNFSAVVASSSTRQLS